MSLEKEASLSPRLGRGASSPAREHYDNQTEDEQVAEHEAAFLAEGQTVMVVPTELVPQIVKLISKKRPA